MTGTRWPVAFASSYISCEFKPKTRQKLELSQPLKAGSDEIPALVEWMNMLKLSKLHSLSPLASWANDVVVLQSSKTLEAVLLKLVSVAVSKENICPCCKYPISDDAVNVDGFNYHEECACCAACTDWVYENKGCGLHRDFLFCKSCLTYARLGDEHEVDDEMVEQATFQSAEENTSCDDDDDVPAFIKWRKCLFSLSLWSTCRRRSSSASCSSVVAESNDVAEDDSVDDMPAFVVWMNRLKAVSQPYKRRRSFTADELLV